MTLGEKKNACTHSRNLFVIYLFWFFLFGFESWWTLVNWLFKILSLFFVFFFLNSYCNVSHFLDLIRSLKKASPNWASRTESIASRIFQKGKRLVIGKTGEFIHFSKSYSLFFMAIAKSSSPYRELWNLIRLWVAPWVIFCPSFAFPRLVSYVIFNLCSCAILARVEFSR